MPTALDEPGETWPNGGRCSVSANPFRILTQSCRARSHARNPISGQGRLSALTPSVTGAA